MIYSFCVFARKKKHTRN